MLSQSHKAAHAAPFVDVSAFLSSFLSERAYGVCWSLSLLLLILLILMGFTG